MPHPPIVVPAMGTPVEYYRSFNVQHLHPIAEMHFLLFQRVQTLRDRQPVFPLEWLEFAISACR